jgi:hypothetical protein
MLLTRSNAILEFKLVVKQVLLVLSVFKFNQDKSASKIFAHRNECACSWQWHTCL